jgi:hypothetical protein
LSFQTASQRLSEKSGKCNAAILAAVVVASSRHKCFISTQVARYRVGPAGKMHALRDSRQDGGVTTFQTGSKKTSPNKIPFLFSAFACFRTFI